MVALVRPHVPAPALAAFETEIDKARVYINGKLGDVDAELAGPPPNWTIGQRADFCFDDIGDVSLTIDALWDSGPGTGTLDMTFPNFAQTVTSIGSVVGSFTETAGSSALVANLDGGSQIAIVITLPLANVGPGTSTSIDWLQATGELYTTPPGGEATLISRLGIGDINVVSGSPTTGSAWFCQ